MQQKNPGHPLPFLCCFLHTRCKYCRNLPENGEIFKYVVNQAILGNVFIEFDKNVNREVVDGKQTINQF